MTCIECKNVIPANSRYCINCGASQQKFDETPAWESTSTTSNRSLPATSCPECGGERVKARPDYFVLRKIVAVEEDDGNFSPVQALVCTECGLTNLYAAAPKTFTTTRPEVFNAYILKNQLIKLAEQVFENRADRIVQLFKQHGLGIPALRERCNQARQVGQTFISKSQADQFYEQAMLLIEESTKRS